MDRRGFLAAGAAAAAATAFGTQAVPAATPRPRRGAAPRPVDVIVIGAGLSGLNAALLLQGEGARVTVLEGAARIGGRVHTADGIRTRPEYGASQVGRSYARTLDLVQRLGVKLVAEDRQIMPFASHLGGRWIKAADWAGSDLNPLPEDMRSVQPVGVCNALLGKFNRLEAVGDWLDPRMADLDVSFVELFRRNGISDAVMRIAAINAASMTDASALALMQELNRGRIDRVSPDTSAPATRNIEGGTSRLVEAMAAKLERPLQLNRIVARVDMTARGASVECLDGTTLRADFVVAAIPFSLLRHVDVRPGFAGLQLEAVQELRYLDTTRAYLAISEPFWDADGVEPSFVSDGAIEMFWAIDNHVGRGEYKGMMVLTGDRAVRFSGVPPADVPAALLRELARIRPASAGKVEVLTWNSWAAEPLIRGCRHMFAPGQIRRFAQPMIAPWQRLHLAGEHTRRSDFGMESALESGERAAVEILAA